MADPAFPLTGKRVYVAGHRGMAGSAIVRRLARTGCDIVTRASAELDLRDQAATRTFFEAQRPEVVVLAAAKVGGIHANSAYPADFLADNLQIQTNAILSAHAVGVQRLLFLGSTCIYPKLAAQPLTEDSLLTGPLEPTNEWYAVAKIAGIKLCQALRRQHGRRYISAMPTNLYGPGDNYHPENSHVVAALIRRFHEAKTAGAPAVTVWGTGTPRREFMFVDDMADACVFLLERYDGEEIVNVGVGEDQTIADFAQRVAAVVGYGGQLVFDPSKPDGTPRKLVDVERLSALGWRATTSLSDGLAAAYRDFLGGDRAER